MNSIQVVTIRALSVLVVFLFLDLFVPIMRLLGILLMHTYNDVLYVFVLGGRSISLYSSCLHDND